MSETKRCDGVRYFFYSEDGKTEKVVYSPAEKPDIIKQSPSVIYFHYDEEGRERDRMGISIGEKSSKVLSTHTCLNRCAYNYTGNRNATPVASPPEDMEDRNSVMPANSDDSIIFEDERNNVNQNLLVKKRCYQDDVPNLSRCIPAFKLAMHSVPWFTYNKVAPSEWLDAQKAFLAHCATQARPSVSDTTLLSSSTKKKKWGSFKKSKSLTRLIKERTTPDEKRCIKLQAQGVTPVTVISTSTPTTLEQLGPCLRPDLNDTFIQLQLKEDTVFTATIYVELPPGTDFDLCHVKTELLVGAMMNFLHPYHDVQCLWVRKIQERLFDLLKDRRLLPRFQQPLMLRHFQAVLVLSQDAAGLLRRRESGFLYSLAAVMEIPRKKLLLLYKDRGQ